MGILSHRQPCKAIKMNFGEEKKKTQNKPKVWNIWIALQIFVANVGEHFHKGKRGEVLLF